MSLKLDPVITNAGRAAVVTAAGTGVNLKLGFISIGDANGAGYAPTLGQTALVNEKLREPITSSDKIDNYFHAQTEFVGAAALGVYDVLEIGVHLSNGILFAVYSGAVPIDTMLVGKKMVVRADFCLTDVNADVVSFNITHNFGNEAQIALMNMSLTQALCIAQLTTDILEMKGVKL